MLWIHVVGGLLGILTSAVALLALKGATLHRWSGRLFVCSMLLMTSTAAVLAVAQPSPGNVIPAILTFYMVVTAFVAVRRFPFARQVDIAAMLVALTLGIISFGFGLLRDDDLRTAGAYPPAVYFVFGALALGAGAQDMRMIAARGLQGAARLQRHLGRMCGATIVATASFFLGNRTCSPAGRSSQWRSAPFLFCS